MDHARSTCLSGLIREHVRHGKRDLAAFIPLHSGSWQRAQAWTTAAVCRTSRRWGRSLWRCLSKRGEFRRLHLVRSELCGEVSFAQRRGRTHRTPGGSRQPHDRQVRYYSEGTQEASRHFWYFWGRKPETEEAIVENSHKMPKRHSPVGWRLGTCTGHWPLEQVGWIVSTLCICPAGFRFVALALAGFCVLAAADLKTWQPVTSLAPS